VPEFGQKGKGEIGQKGSAGSQTRPTRSAWVGNRRRDRAAMTSWSGTWWCRPGWGREYGPLSSIAASLATYLGESTEPVRPARNAELHRRGNANNAVIGRCSRRDGRAAVAAGDSRTELRPHRVRLTAQRATAAEPVGAKRNEAERYVRKAKARGRFHVRDSSGYIVIGRDAPVLLGGCAAGVEKYRTATTRRVSALVAAAQVKVPKTGSGAGRRTCGRLVDEALAGARVGLHHPVGPPTAKVGPTSTAQALLDASGRVRGSCTTHSGRERGTSCRAQIVAVRRAGLDGVPDDRQRGLSCT